MSMFCTVMARVSRSGPSTRAMILLRVSDLMTLADDAMDMCLHSMQEILAQKVADD